MVRSFKLLAFSLLVLGLSLPMFSANPTGALYLYLDDSNHQICFFSLDGSNNTQNCTVATGGISLGAHTVFAKYHNTDNTYHDAQSEPATITVDDPLSTVTITVTPVPTETKQGQPIAVTITLTPQ